MLGMNWQQRPLKQLLIVLLVAVLMWGLFGCTQAPDGSRTTAISKASRSRLAEVSPPFTLQNLRQSLEVYQPQVKILNPRPNQVLEDTQVEVQLQVKDLPLFKDENLELGPYLQVLLDNQPYAQVYDASEPLTISDLTPGTHTLRVFAVRPWHESFKNEGAFALSTFHIFTATPEHNPDPSRPLLTYNYPQGVYGAEPVLLDFYLTNAPLHLVAREDSQDAIPDWQIRCTINGESFTFDRWEPIYLKGFKPGKNWVQMELLDENGNPLPNAFNHVVQLVTYEPNGTDTLARLTRGELTAEAARKIVDPNYVPPPPLPEPTVEPEVIIEPDLTQEPQPETMPPEMIAPAAPEAESEIEPETELEVEPIDQPAEVEESLDFEGEPSESVTPSIEPLPAPAKDFNAEDQEQPLVSKPLKPAPVQPTPVQPDTDFSEPERSEAEEEVEELFQVPEQAQTLPLELERPAPATPVEVEAVPQPQPSISSKKTLLDKSLSGRAESQAVPTTPVIAPQSLELSVPVVPVVNPEQPLDLLPQAFSSELPSKPSATPNFLELLDRAKAFFEGLRKPPNELNVPLLAPSLNGLDVPEVSDVAPSGTDQNHESMRDILVNGLPEDVQAPALDKLLQKTPAPSE